MPKYTFTQADVVMMRKASESITYFASLLKIIDVHVGKIPFTPYLFQSQALSLMDSHLVMPMPRQMGTTTMLLVKALHTVLLSPNKFVVYVSHKFESAADGLRRLLDMYQSLPECFRANGLVVENKGNVEFENGSAIKVISPTTTLRGYSVSTLLCDNAAYYSNSAWKDFMTNIYPTIMAGKNSKMIVASSAGEGEFFRDMIKHKTFPIFTAHWGEHPERNKNWERLVRGNSSDEMFEREYGLQDYRDLL